MKRMIHSLMAVAVLVSAMTCTAFAATTGYTTDVNGTVNYDEAAGTYSASCSGLIAGNQYVLLVAEGTPDSYTITEDSILYIDQAASDGSVSFPAFIPMNIDDSVVLLGGEFSDGTSPKVLGTIISQYTLGDVNDDGQVTAGDALDILQHTVQIITLEGNAMKAADVDGTPGVSAGDALSILQYTVGLIEGF